MSQKMNNVEDLIKGIHRSNYYMAFVVLLLSMNYFPIAINNVCMAFYGHTPLLYCQEDKYSSNMSVKKYVDDVKMNNTSYKIDGNGSLNTGPEGPNLQLHTFPLLSINNESIFLNVTGDGAGLHETYREEIEACDLVGKRCPPGHWKFDVEGGETTIVTEWELVCDDAYLPSLSTTIYFIGVTIGGPLFGSLSDKYGRKIIMLVTLYIHVALGIVLVFVPNIVTFTTVRFFLGMVVQGLQTSTDVLCLELVPTNFRPLAAGVMCVFWGLGTASMSGYSYFLKDWRYTQLAVAVPGVLTIFYPCVIPESFRWHIAKRKYEKAKKTFMNISKHGKYKLEPHVTEHLLQNEEAHYEKQDNVARGSVIDLFKTREIRKRVLVLFFGWFSSSLGYFGLTLKLTSFAGDKYVNFLIGGLLEIPCYLTSIFLMRKVGRKKTYILFFAISGISCVIAGAIPSDAPYGSDFITVFAVTGKFVVSSLFCIGLTFTCELFPTNIRSIAMGTCAFVNRMGGVLAPQAVLLGHVNKSLPVVLFGSMCVGSAALSLLLPETKGKRLPNTIDEVEKGYVENDELNVFYEKK